MATSTQTNDWEAKANALISELSPEELYSLASRAITHLVSPPSNKGDLSGHFRKANQLHAHLMACEVQLAQTIDVDVSNENGKLALKQQLVREHGVPVTIANTIVAGVEAGAMMDTRELLIDGVVPVDVLASAVKSTKNQLREDIGELDARAVFADIAKRLRLKSSACAAEGVQMSRGQARWAVQQVLREHPDKVEPAGTRQKRSRQKTVHVSVNMKGGIESVRCGNLLDDLVLSRTDSGWLLSDKTVDLMGKREVAVRVKAEAPPSESDIESPMNSSQTISPTQSTDSSIKTKAPTKMSRHQRRKLRKQQTEQSRANLKSGVTR